MTWNHARPPSLGLGRLPVVLAGPDTGPAALGFCPFGAGPGGLRWRRHGPESRIRVQVHTVDTLKLAD